jgi:hypothetical protein
MATEVVEPMVPPPASNVGNLDEGHVVPGVDIAQTADSLWVEGTAGGGDVGTTPSEEVMLPPPSVIERDVEMLAAVENLVAVTSRVGGDVMEASAADAAAVHLREVIDLDEPDLLGNDTAILEVVLEQLLLDPEES